ncbi:MAG: DUF455 family protein [Caldilineae bacterium]|nr:DUF455 family protein [Chloroflexota bacterium]MCB9177491.1 DUF455 family protein [Caldilineae bacterium]
MEVRAFAEQVVLGRTLEAKLAPAPRDLVDRDPRPRRLPVLPNRPAQLRIVPARVAPRTPSIEGMTDPAQRARILHAMANHELQAAELYAWALLAFPEAPPAFRQDLLTILGDEQRHTRMYVSRCAALGLPFGSLPVTGYFWNKLDTLTSPLRFACAMALTFENANLDHTIDYAAAARLAGDPASAAVIDKVHVDEQRHVRFGWEWLGRLKPADRSMWQAYCDHVDWPLRPELARGKTFHRSGRLAAGLDPEFIRLLEAHEIDRSPEARRRREP